MAESNERTALQQVLDALGELEPDARLRVFRTVATFFDIPAGQSVRAPASSATSPIPTRDDTAAGPQGGSAPVFSGHRALSPKEFMLEKDPKTDVDRVVCLAYYLAHYRDAPHFKTGDISKLNTEAAQRKLANTAYSINHALQRGYFVHAPQNTKQISAMGEQYVEALPNRAAAKDVLVRFRPRKAAVRKSRKGTPLRIRARRRAKSASPSHRLQP